MSDIETKSADQHLQSTEKVFSASNDERILAFTPDEQRKIIRRIDARLVVTLGFLNCVTLLDRNNLGFASIAGMQKDLHMNAENNAYTIVSITFFISYTLLQVPVVVVIRILGPRNFLAGIVFMWGAVMIVFGFTPTWNVMALLRVILGALEAGFYPGCVYLMSTWYPRYDLQKRNALFLSIGTTASGFGGILAYGIMQMDGISGFAGWRWIFILEGLLTCLLGIGSWLLIVGFPQESPKSWSFLNEAEAAFVVARIEHDRSDAFVEPFSVSGYLGNAWDSKVWAFAALFMLTTMVTSSISYFLPIILRSDMGFTIAAAQCLTAPPYVIAAIVMCIQAHFADRMRLRGPTIVGNALMGILGLALLGYAKNSSARYFGVFLAVTSSHANYPAILTYQRPSNNVRGQWKRALTSGILVAGSGLGGIIGTTVFRAKDAPNYRPGILATVLANALVVIIVAVLSVKFHRANKHAVAGEKPIEGLVGFKYTL